MRYEVDIVRRRRIIQAGMAFFATPVPVPGANGFSTTNKASSITVSSGGFVATATAGAGEGNAVRTVTGRGTGQWCVAATLTNSAGNANLAGLGIGLATYGFTIAVGNYIGGAGSYGNLATGYYGDSFAYTNNSVVDTYTAFVQGDTILCAFKIDTGLVECRMWAKVNAGDWNNDAGADPSTDTGGTSATAASGAGLLYFLVEGGVSGQIWTVDTTPVGQPAGYSSWN